MKNTTDQWQHTRDWLAGQMGVDEQRKTEVYLEVAQSATLRDATYWLQIIFSAGIATIGLALSSPAVIIGGMLISPLMGPILSLGLALAAGDFILLVRAIANLSMSCTVAISFSMLLIFSLPFKEATSEILSRTTPNTLDLGVALFSGAIGTIATCRPVKGVITSIPGVSIAVALMPPLCVVGYGVGIAFSLNFNDGLQISRGGSLLFLTNLVAIAFASTLVFLALHIDTDKVRERVKMWEADNLESRTLQEFLGRYKFLQKLRPIGGLAGRLFVGLLAIVALLIPLSNSFVRLSEEVSQKQQQNKLRRTATDIWENNYSNSFDDQPRSSIERLSITEQNQSIIVRLSIFTSKLYSPEERNQYVQELARKLNRDPEKIQLLLTEIPTASNEILAKKEEVTLPAELKPPSIGELQKEVLQTLDGAIANISLPPNAKLLNYAMTTGKNKSTEIAITYLSDRPMSEDAQLLVINDVQRRMDIANAEVSLEYISRAIGEVAFAENVIIFSDVAKTQLDQIGSLLQKYPDLNLLLSINLRALESDNLRSGRFQAIASYLFSEWQIEASRISLSPLSNAIIISPTESNTSTPVEIDSPTLPQDGKVTFQLEIAPSQI